MDKTVQEIMAKVAQYIERTQPLIDQQNEQRDSFVKRATQAAGVLAHRGVIGSNQVNSFVDSVVADPAKVWSFVEKLAAAVSADTMGQGVREKMAAGKPVDPFERAFFGVGEQHSGMVETE